MPSKPPLELFRQPETIERAALDGAYAGAWAEMLMNPRASLVDVILADVRAQAEASLETPYYPDPALRGTVAQLLKAWNWADSGGTPLPPTREGVDQLPWPAIRALIGAWFTAQALPKLSEPSSPTTPEA